MSCRPPPLPGVQLSAHMERSPLLQGPRWDPARSHGPRGVCAYQQGVVGATSTKRVFVPQIHWPGHQSFQHRHVQPIGHGESGLNDRSELHGVSGKDNLWHTDRQPH